jgi:hypothetical protein
MAWCLSTHTKTTLSYTVTCTHNTNLWQCVIWCAIKCWIILWCAVTWNMFEQYWLNAVSLSLQTWLAHSGDTLHLRAPEDGLFCPWRNTTVAVPTLHLVTSEQPSAYRQRLVVVFVPAVLSQPSRFRSQVSNNLSLQMSITWNEGMYQFFILSFNVEFLLN